MNALGQSKKSGFKDITFHLGYLPQGLTLRATRTNADGIEECVLDVQPINEEQGEQRAVDFLKDQGFTNVTLRWV
jgi:hypothetical protein